MTVFTIELLTKSDTATRRGITEQFTPPADVIEAGRLLYQMVLSKIPFVYHINSFYRCDRLNKVVGGSATSDHKLGRSADLDSVGNANNGEIFNFIRANCEFDQLIWEFGNDTDPDWVHVSYRKTGNRKQVLKAVKRSGKTVYLPM